MYRVIALFVIVALSGCSSVSIGFSPEAKQHAVYNQGVPFVRVADGPVKIMVGASSEEFKPGESASLSVSIANQSAPTFNFGIENVSATCDGKPLHVFTYEELKKQEEHEANMQRLAVALGSIGDSLNDAGRQIAASQPKTSYTSGQFNSGKKGSVNIS